MNTWKEIKDQIPNAKELTKGKKITLYKAFRLNDGDKMNIDTNFDMFSFTMQDAILNLINREGLRTVVKDNNPEDTDQLELLLDNASELIGADFVISFAAFTFDKTELTQKDLVNNDMLTYEDGSITITLSDKLYKVDVIDMRVDEIRVIINDNTCTKSIKALRLTEVI